MELSKHIEIELRHIQLELSCRRKQHMRHFIDQYYCYQNGFVNKNNYADWNQIFWTGYVSEGALALNSRNRSEVIKEHVIPMKVIVNELLNHAKADKIELAEIKAVLDALLVYATITKEEDALLNKSGFKSKLPPNTNPYENPLARYHSAGIKLIHVSTSK